MFGSQSLTKVDDFETTQTGSIKNYIDERQSDHFNYHHSRDPSTTSQKLGTLWSQGIGDQEAGDYNKEDRQLDSSFVSCEFVNHQYILSKWDYFCYLIGLGARLQTFFVAYILYFVETENMCLVHWDSPRPLLTSTFAY